LLTAHFLQHVPRSHSFSTSHVLIHATWSSCSHSCSMQHDPLSTMCSGCCSVYIIPTHLRILGHKDGRRISLSKMPFILPRCILDRSPLPLTRILDLGWYCPLWIIRWSKITSGSGRMVDVSDTKGRWVDGCVTCPWCFLNRLTWNTSWINEPGGNNNL
jgi:hypothetical protein